MRIHEMGHIVLYVADLKKSADFYRDILGFKEIHRDQHTALYSSGRTHHELLLIAVGEPSGLAHDDLELRRRGQGQVTPGLYHIGFKIGNTDDELRTAIGELESKGVVIKGAADHHVTHSLYVLDPDGNELELYVDVDDSWVHDHSKILRPTKRLTL